MLTELIKQITLQGWEVKFGENPLGVKACGKRVLNVDIEKDGRTIGTGVHYNIANEETLTDALQDLQFRIKK